MAATIREWARAQGLEVKSRGLIPRDIIEAYKAAHGIGLPRPRPLKPRVHQDRISKLWLGELPVLTPAGECVGWYTEQFDQHAHAFTFALTRAAHRRVTMTDPIIPPYLEQRIRVAGIFQRYIAEADAVLDSPRAAILEALRAEVLDVLDPTIEAGDIPRT